MNRAFWAGKRVFLTGHTGFKGGWLSLALQDMGASVHGFALAAPTQPSLFEVARVAQCMESIQGDVRDHDAVLGAIQRAAPDIVLHLAAQALVRPSYADPVETYATNVMGTVNVLDAVRRTPSVRLAIVVTSDKCYQNNEWVWGYREGEPMGGFDPYSSSKGCAELVTAAYRSSFFTSGAHDGRPCAIASVRAGNVIGGGDWATDRLIPDIMAAFMAQRSALIRNPDAIRPWQHVLESIGGYLLLAERLWADGPGYSEAWNFGADDSDCRPVAWIAQRLTDLWGEGAQWHSPARTGAAPHEATWLKLDCSKAKARLGWRPRLDLAGALQWTVEWYRQARTGADMREQTLSQIRRFSALERS